MDIGAGPYADIHGGVGRQRVDPWPAGYANGIPRRDDGL